MEASMSSLYFAKRVANLVTPPAFTKIILRVKYLWLKKTIKEGAGYLDNIAELLFRKNNRLTSKEGQIAENEGSLLMFPQRSALLACNHSIALKQSHSNSTNAFAKSFYKSP